MCVGDNDDELIGTWYRMSDFDGLARSDASSFTIGNKGCLLCGDDSKRYLNDFFAYDPAAPGRNKLLFPVRPVWVRSLLE